MTNLMQAVDTAVSEASFDAFAEDYDAALDVGLQATGENKEYFIRRRLSWLRSQLEAIPLAPERVLDYGCGCGDSCGFIFDDLHVKSYVGIDISRESLRVALVRNAAADREFREARALSELGDFDLAYCNGVFHHIPPAQRMAALRGIHNSLRPGGYFSFWENNPWNPGTRWVMSRIPFDRDAVLISPPEARQLLREAGFEITTTTFLFIFPHTLRWLRNLEFPLARLPIGGQYQILARRTDSSGAVGSN